MNADFLDQPTLPQVAGNRTNLREGERLIYPRKPARVASASYKAPILARTRLVSSVERPFRFVWSTIRPSLRKMIRSA